MEQWVKWAELGARPGNRSLIPRAYMVERREPAPTNCPLTATCVSWYVHTGANKCKQVKKLISFFDQSRKLLST